MLLRHLFQMSQVIAAAFLLSCASTTQTNDTNRQYAAGTGPSDKLQLPAPFDTPSARNNAKVIGWPKGKMPTAAPGFEVSLFAENLDLSLIHISEPTRLLSISYAVFCLKK